MEVTPCNILDSKDSLKMLWCRTRHDILRRPVSMLQVGQNLFQYVSWKLNRIGISGNWRPFGHLELMFTFLGSFLSSLYTWYLYLDPIQTHPLPVPRNFTPSLKGRVPQCLMGLAGRGLDHIALKMEVGFKPRVMRTFSGWSFS